MEVGRNDLDLAGQNTFDGQLLAGMRLHICNLDFVL